MALEIVRNDDFIEYFLFPNIDQLTESDEEDKLGELLEQINEISRVYTKNYIWHKDPFVLKARNRKSHLLNPESKGESCKIRVT
jgi:hemerythrin superfamily protein